MNKFVLLAASANLVGCAALYSQDEKLMAIEVFAREQSLPKHCVHLGRIEGTSHYDPNLSIVDLKRKAIEKNATHVIARRLDYGIWTQKSLGDAYRCEDVAAIDAGS